MRQRCIGVTVIAWAATLVFAQDSWNVRDHVPLDAFLIQAHRGAGMLMPENSLPAFEIAWGIGTAPEADLRTTKDGVIVAFHDSDLRRVLPDADAPTREKGIGDLAYDEVAALDVGAWRGEQYRGQRVPRMTDVYEVLKRYPDRRMYIDIKEVDFAQLANESQAVHEQLILASTKYDEVKRWKSLAPDSQTLHWMGGSEEVLRQRLERLERERFAGVDQLQIHVRFDADGKMSPSAQFLTAAGQQLRRHGVLFQVFPWETKDPAAFARLLDLGVASFASDFPDVTAESVRQYYRQANRKKFHD
jgi:glycerophosphoryl diester phosphodiesterase